MAIYKTIAYNANGVPLHIEFRDSNVDSFSNDPYKDVYSFCENKLKEMLESIRIQDELSKFLLFNYVNSGLAKTFIEFLNKGIVKEDVDYMCRLKFRDGNYDTLSTGIRDCGKRVFVKREDYSWSFGGYIDPYQETFHFIGPDCKVYSFVS